MEIEAGAVVQDNDGSGVATPEEALGGQEAAEEVGADKVQEPGVAAATRPEDENLPPELRPDADGNPPELTPALFRKLRGKYFTVKHPMLANCGHRFDKINEPRTNCENCWWNFFNTHPSLVETTDQFFRVHGKRALVAMRGEKYFKMFVRYMATVIHFMKEEGRLKGDDSGNQNQQPGSTDGTAQEAPGNGTILIEG